MSNKTIFDLNEYCFYNILAYLDSEDHANFSQVCQRFRQVVLTWSARQYKDFTANRWNLKMFFIALEYIEKLRFDLDAFWYISIRQSSVHQQNMIRNFCKQFQNMKALKRFELYLIHSRYETLSHLNICDEMVKFLKDLLHLTELEIVCDYYANAKYNLNAFCELKLLTSFSADGDVDINLKELCKSNENLIYLKLNRYCGNISDIVPFCSNLKTLEYNTCKNICNYAALGELPQLQVLKIHTFKYCEEMKRMYRKLASTNILQELVLWSYPGYEYVDLEATKEICKIKSLNILECVFEDYECVKYVAQLTNLKDLRCHFSIRDNSVDLSASLYHILRECKKLEYMYINATDLPQSFLFRAFKVLEVVRNPVEQKPLELCLLNWKFDLSSQDKELYKSCIDFKKHESFVLYG